MSKAACHRVSSSPGSAPSTAERRLPNRCALSGPQAVEIRGISIQAFLRLIVLIALISGGFDSRSSHAASDPACEEIRAAIDIGSGTTKMVVARVNACHQRVIEILTPQPGAKLERVVKYKKNILALESGAKVFSPAIVVRGLEALAELKQIAVSFGAQKFAAVATAAFRQISEPYARELVTLIEKRLAIPVRVLSQSKEARIGFLGVAVQADISPEALIVWDIGGGSMQISHWDAMAGDVAAYEGHFASEAMLKFAIDEHPGRAYGSDSSPNPMLTQSERSKPENNLTRTIRKAEAVTRETISNLLMVRLTPEDRLVVGIGGVHFYSNCELVRKFSSEGCRFTRDELFARILADAGLSDEQLFAAGVCGSLEFCPYRITNGALTVGFMKVLGFERILTMKINMANGILLSTEHWQ